MPLRVRRLMPSSVRAPTRALIAARISPSVTVSQRQMIRPYVGSFFTCSASSSGVISRVLGQYETSPEIASAGFFAAPRRAATCSARNSPIAGADVRPGDSTPSALKKPGTPSGSPSTKSLTVVSCARMPLKFLMAARTGSAGKERFARRVTFAMISAVVALSSLSAMSSLDGPTITVPSTVGETRMPLPIGPGTWKIVALNAFPSERSSM